MGDLERLLPGGAREVRRRPGVRRARAAARRAAAGRRRAHARALAARSSTLSTAATSTTVYERLGVGLRDDDLAARASTTPRCPTSRPSSRRRGSRASSDGALCVFPPGFTNREGEPLPLIVRKQDGGYGYATTDLAALRYRAQTLRRHAAALRRRRAAGAAPRDGVRRRARRRAGCTPPARAEHVAFGSVLGADKKMLKTRAGDTVRLIDLLDEAVERAAAELARREPGRSTRARARALAPQIGIGAVKYADLSNDRIKDYVFDWDRMLAFDGNTAPVPAVRARPDPLDLPQAPRSAVSRARRAARSRSREPAERALALELLASAARWSKPASTLQPHRLCGYLYDLATAFTAFYENCPVLKAPDDATRASRLALCDLTARVLARGPRPARHRRARAHVALGRP